MTIFSLFYYFVSTIEWLGITEQMLMKQETLISSYMMNKSILQFCQLTFLVLYLSVHLDLFHSQPLSLYVNINSSVRHCQYYHSVLVISIVLLSFSRFQMIVVQGWTQSFILVIQNCGQNY